MTSRRLVVGIAAVAAVLLLVSALFGQFQGGPGTPVRRAFAEAGPGYYAVAIRNEGSFDTILAVNPADPGTVREAATISHLNGYTSFGAVSPTGDAIALVVADSGSQANPIASLYRADLATGAVTLLASGIDYLQQPIWTPDGASVLVSRSDSQDSPSVGISILRASATGSGTDELLRLEAVAAAYPVGFDAGGTPLIVAIEQRGSVLHRPGRPDVILSPNITRDWRTSPGGGQLAFIEADLSNGLQYRLSVVALSESAAVASAQSLPAASSQQQLGVAWPPAGDRPLTAEEPLSGQARAASGPAAGFDIPLGFSPDGSNLVVEAWTGTSFESPGLGRLEITGNGGRLALAGANRFAGWVVR
ncbi:MAG: hypothetical protein KC495_02715 [Dehalococcoidia bacterium]|nr:hypothetical protein [Dehalococcoidia bacterium]MCB9485341.1 hypothetical protein [Thermoflexaceae bacterium]